MDKEYIMPLDYTTKKFMFIAEVEESDRRIKVLDLIYLNTDIPWLKKLNNRDLSVIISDIENDTYSKRDVFTDCETLVKLFEIGII